MSNETIATILWVAAAAVFILYILRRKGRKNKAFR